MTPDGGGADPQGAMPLKVPWTVLRRTTWPRPTSSVKAIALFSALLPLVWSQGQPKIDVSQISLSSIRWRSPPFTHTPAEPTSWMRQARTAQSEE